MLETKSLPPSWGGALRRRLVAGVVVFAGLAGASALGCQIILDIEPIELTPSGDSCWDMTGFDGRGCFRTDTGCKPTTHEEIINVCTDADCRYFDNLDRLNLKPGDSLPPLPQSNGGTGGGGGSGAGGEGGGAPALDLCEDLPAPRVYITGSNAIEPVLRELGPILASAPTPISIIYQKQSSCRGMTAIVHEEPITGTAAYWVTSESKVECALPAGGVKASIGSCDVFADTCQDFPNGLPKEVRDIENGPIQAMTFIVPETAKSSINAISREAAYFVYGLESGVEPWVDPTYILRRDESSGTQAMISAAIKVPIKDWRGEPMASTQEMFETLKAKGMSGDADKTIGIFDVVNGKDTTKDPFLRVLAFQGTSQRCGFFPDTKPGGTDLGNVRDGHYLIWGRMHFFVRLDNNGTPESPEARVVVDYITGTQALPGIDDQDLVLRILAQGNLIPQCAMRVTRSEELGPLEPFTPTSPCSCFFEKNVTKETICQECSGDDACPAAAPKCRHGFCEPF